MSASKAGPIALFLQALQEVAERPDRVSAGDRAIRAGLEELLNAADRVIRRRILRRGSHRDLIEPAGRTLVVGIERAQRVDRVAEQLDTDGFVGRRGKQIDNPTATRDLPGPADDVDAA